MPPALRGRTTKTATNQDLSQPTRGTTKQPTRYECDICGKTVGRVHDLRRHKMTHTGEKPYQCLKCDRSFAQQSALKTHDNVHTGEKPFKCELAECPSVFGDPSSCTRHRREQHNKIVYVCPIPECGHLDKRPANFLRHMERFHKISRTRIKPNDYKMALVTEESENSSGSESSGLTSATSSPQSDPPFLPREPHVSYVSRGRRPAPRRSQRLNSHTDSEIEDTSIDPQLLEPDEYANMIRRNRHLVGLIPQVAGPSSSRSSSAGSARLQSSDEDFDAFMIYGHQHASVAQPITRAVQNMDRSPYGQFYYSSTSDLDLGYRGPGPWMG